MMFVFYCLMSKTKPRSLYFLYKEDFCMQISKAPDLWHAPLPSQTTKAFPWKIWEKFTPVLLSAENCLFSEEIPWETQFQLLLSERLLPCLLM